TTGRGIPFSQEVSLDAPRTPVSTLRFLVFGRARCPHCNTTTLQNKGNLINGAVHPVVKCERCDVIRVFAPSDTAGRGRLVSTYVLSACASCGNRTYHAHPHKEGSDEAGKAPAPDMSGGRCVSCNPTKE